MMRDFIDVMNANNPTPFEVATDFDLWSEYIDPQGELTRAAFNQMDVDDKIALITECFGIEES